jgi:iron-sulfur cluster assembly protein
MLSIQPVTISKRAAGEVKKIMQTKNIPAGYCLRVGVRGGGCGGAQVIIGFDKPQPNDLRYAVEGIDLLVDKKHTLYVVGKQVDFYEGSDARGFLLTDPA